MKPRTRMALNYLYFAALFVFSIHCLFDLSFNATDSTKYVVALLWVCGVFNQVRWAEQRTREQELERGARQYSGESLPPLVLSNRG